jgi:hypothetical protein
MYFFDVLERDGRVSRDMVGVELEGPHRALETASQTVIDVVRDTGMRHRDFKVQVIVRDESGRELGRRDAELRRTDEPD